MARQTGGTTIAGYAPGTFGTPVALGAGDGFAFSSLTHSLNPTELNAAPLGRGLAMLTDSLQGSLSPGGSVEGNPTYDSAYLRMLFAFYGAGAAPTEQTVGEGDYLHRILFQEALRFGTLAFETSTTTTMEYTSIVPQSINITASDVPSYLQGSVEFVSGDRDESSSTNDNAQLATVTRSDDEEIIVRPESSFLINAQSGGALTAPGDCVAIESYDLTLTRPKRYVREIKCTAGLSAPIEDGLFEGELTVQFSGLDDHTWYDAANNETLYKALLQVDGTQINAGVNKQLSIYLPQLKVVQDPTYDITDEGENPHTVTFRVLAASANPTGMNSQLPYMEVINERSTAYFS